MSNTGITLVEVRTEAMDVITKLKEGKIDIKAASEIRSLLSVVIDTAKVQVDFLRSLPNSVKEQLKVDEVKAIAGTLNDRDAELDLSMSEIKKNKDKNSLIAE